MENAFSLLNCNLTCVFSAFVATVDSTTHESVIRLEYMHAM